jgi:hypothetical protein
VADIDDAWMAQAILTQANQKQRVYAAFDTHVLVHYNQSGDPDGVLPEGLNRIMGKLFPDTHPEAKAILLQLLRNAPSWRKFKMVAQLNASVQTLALSGLRQRYSQAGEAELRRRLADVLLGTALAAEVYGPLVSGAEPNQQTKKQNE